VPDFTGVAGRTSSRGEGAGSGGSGMRNRRERNLDAKPIRPSGKPTTTEKSINAKMLELNLDGKLVKDLSGGPVVNKNNEVVIQPKYEYASTFYKGYMIRLIERMDKISDIFSG